MSLSPAEAEQLQGLIGTMVGLEYLTMEDVARIPRRAEPFGVAVYAPLDRAPMRPDVVLVRGNPRQLMLLAEAAQSAGAAGTTPALGRPTCAVLPEAITSGRTRRASVASAIACTPAPETTRRTSRFRATGWQTWNGAWK
ncbi:MAG: DUF169 domain-containing protein [Myxococcales bacterium]